MVDKIISNVVKAAVGAAYTAMIGSIAFTCVSATKRSNESHKLAVKREEVGLPGYKTLAEHEAENLKIENK
jgi:hypothetical protein